MKRRSGGKPTLHQRAWRWCSPTLPSSCTTPTASMTSSCGSPRPQYQPSPAAGWRASPSVSGAGIEPPRPPIRPRRPWIKRQYQSHEGPCLDAVDAAMVYAQSFPDERWPTLASRPTESGVQSALSYRLAAASSGTADSGGGSLNSYGVIPSAFNDTAQQIGLILAAHDAVAARAVEERSTLQSLGRDLQQALLSRDVIGQAKGILMERLEITPEDAFDLLRRSSQHLNLKLRDVARGLAETGEFRMTRTSRPADQQ